MNELSTDPSTTKEEPSSRPFLDVSQMRKVYPTPKGDAVILDDFNLKVKKGEFITFIGHSGCGKSTALTMIAGLNSITAGVVILAGKEVTGPGPDRGVVFQSPCLLPWMTAFDNVLLGVNQVYFHGTRQQRREITEYYLTRVGLRDAMHKRPAELSNGMKQRVGIARAFALSPKMLLLDEPFGMLDQLTKAELQDVLLDLWGRDRKTAIMVTHDVDEAIYLSDRVVMLTNGPAARVDGILDIEFERPRDRLSIMNDPRYYEYSQHLINFLENCESEKDRLARQKKESPPKNGGTPTRRLFSRRSERTAVNAS